MLGGLVTAAANKDSVYLSCNDFPLVIFEKFAMIQIHDKILYFAAAMPLLEIHSLSIEHFSFIRF